MGADIVLERVTEEVAECLEQAINSYHSRCDKESRLTAALLFTTAWVIKTAVALCLGPKTFLIHFGTSSESGDIEVPLIELMSEPRVHNILRRDLEGIISSCRIMVVKDSRPISP